MNRKNMITPKSFIFFLLSYLLLCAFQAPQKNIFLDDSYFEKDTLAACYLLEEKEILISTGNYQAAFIALEKAQILYVTHNQWERTIQCIIQLAQLVDIFEAAEQKMDGFEATEQKIKYGNLGVQLAQKHLPKDHPLIAAAFRQKAEAFMRIGFLDSAVLYLTQAIPIFKKHQTWTELAWSEILLGLNYFHQYQLDACQEHYQKVEQLLQQQLLPQREQTEIHTTLLSLLGVLYEQQGDYDKAIQNTKEALHLEIAKGIHTEHDSSFVSNHYTNLGAFYHYKGDYQRAMDNSMQAMNAYNKASQDPLLLHNIGEILTKQKKYNESIDYLKKSFVLTSHQGKGLHNRMDVFQGLGIVFLKLGLIDSAIYYLQEATQLSTDYRKPFAWSTLGNAFNRKGQLQDAFVSLSIAKNSYLQDSTASQHSPFVLSNIYRYIGNAHVLKQNPNTALLFYQKALIANHATFRDSFHIETNPSLKGIYEPRYFWNTLIRKAKTLASFPDSSKNLATALATYQVLIQWTDSLQASHATETASLDWSGEFKQIYEEAIEVAFRLYQQTQESDYLELAFSFSEKSKNSLLLESLKATEGKSYSGIPDSLLQKEKDLNIDIAFYEKVLQKAQDDQEEAKTKLYQNYLSKSRLELVELREALERDFPKFRQWKQGGETTSIAEIQSQLLDKQTAFLEYFVGDSSTFVFVITPHSADFLQLESPIELQKKAAEFRATLLNPDALHQDAKAAFADYQNKAHSLYQAILQPIVATLSDDIQQVILVPDEFLNNLPLEALTTSNSASPSFDFAQLPYLLYDYSLQYAYSANLLLQNQHRQKQLPANAECLAFAPPYKEGAIASTQRGSLQQLRNTGGFLEGTAREIQAIARFFNGQFDFSSTATERQFKQFAPQFGILHLAMHGVPDFENANFNHLQFSNLETDTLEDNLLYHYEIANMDLQAQLVVLSACETGVGKYEKGEGVYSLARSFMYAGVPSVVMSLWKVSDESTSELMPYFYESLASGESKEKALHHAKLRFLEETDLEYRHPFYWSAFVMMGDGTEIREGWGNWLQWLGIGGLALIIGGVFYWRKQGRRNLGFRREKDFFS